MSMLVMGIMNEKALGIARAYAKAMQWYQEAANAGNAQGLIGMAVMYANGRGVQPDIEKARQYLQQAAAMGDLQAQTDLTLLQKPAAQSHALRALP